MFDDFFRSVVRGDKDSGGEVEDGLNSNRPQNGGGSGIDHGTWVDYSAPVTVYTPVIGQTYASAQCEHVATVPHALVTPNPGTSILAASSTFICYLVKNSIRLIQKDSGARTLLRLPPEAGSSTLISMSMSMTLEDNSSFLGCITSGGHLVIWKVLNWTLEKDNDHVVKTEEILFVSNLNETYGPILGLSWWAGSSKDSPTLLLRLWDTVELLSMKNLHTLPIEKKGQSGFSFINRGLAQIGSICTGIHKKQVNDSSFTSEGRVLVTCGEDGKVVLWHTFFLHEPSSSSSTAWPDTVGVLKSFTAHDGAPVTSCFGLKPTKREHGLFQFLTGGKNNYELKLWSVAPHGNIAASPAPHQTILFNYEQESSNERMLLSIVPGYEFIVASCSKQNLLYAMHLNYNCSNNVAGMAKIDYLRPFSVSQRMLSLVALDGTTGPDNCADENRSIGGELSEDMSNTEPELVIHAFLSKGPVQIYHIKVSHAYPGTASPHVYTTEQSATEQPPPQPLKSPYVASEAQQQRDSSMGRDIQPAVTHSPTTSASTLDAHASSGLMSMLRKENSKKNDDWQQNGRNSLGARLPDSGSQNTTVPPGVRGTSKRLSLQTILGGRKRDDEMQKGISGGHSKSESRKSSEDASDTIKTAASPPSIQPYKSQLLSSPPSSAVQLQPSGHSGTLPGLTDVSASCTSGAATQPYDGSRERYPVYPNEASLVINRRTLSTPAAFSSPMELHDSLTNMNSSSLSPCTPAESTKEVQTAIIEGILPAIKYATENAIKQSLTQNAVESAKSTAESVKQSTMAAAHSASVAALKEIQPEITSEVKKLAEDGAYRGASAANAELVPSCIKQANQAIGVSVSKTLQQSVSSAFEMSVIPSIQGAVSCMFKQINSTLQEGFMASPLLNNTASEAFENLVGVRQDINMLTQQLSSLSDSVDQLSQKVEILNQEARRNTGNASPESDVYPEQRLPQINPERDLHPLLIAGKFEHAFDIALTAQDLSAVTWICHRLDPTAVAVKLSQPVLVCLLQNLGLDLTTDVPIKLAWLHHCAICINPHDKLIKQHAVHVIQQLKERLSHVAPVIVQLGGPVVAEHKTLMLILSSLLTS